MSSWLAGFVSDLVATFVGFALALLGERLWRKWDERRTLTDLLQAALDEAQSITDRLKSVSASIKLAVPAVPDTPLRDDALRAVLLHAPAYRLVRNAIPALQRARLRLDEANARLAVYHALSRGERHPPMPEALLLESVDKQLREEVVPELERALNKSPASTPAAGPTGSPDPS